MAIFRTSWQRGRQNRTLLLKVRQKKDTKDLDRGNRSKNEPTRLDGMAWNCSTHELRQEYKLKGTWATVRVGGEPGLQTETFFQKHFF